MSRTRTHTQCTSCGSPDLMAVSISMADGPVDFWTCVLCETTGWERDGSQLSRDMALAHIPRR